MAPETRRRRGLVALVGALLVLPTLVLGVRRGDFKTCKDAGFCRRQRARADRAASASDWRSPYAIVGTPSVSAGSLRATVANAVAPGIAFTLNVDFGQDGTARVRIDEDRGLRQRYNEAAKWSIWHEPVMNTRVVGETKQGETRVRYGKDGRDERELVIRHSPLKLDFLKDGVPHVVLNERALFHMEHFRLKAPTTPAPTGDGSAADPLVVQEEVKPPMVDEQAYRDFLEADEDGMWDETFGGRRDSKPKGPESLALDITFPGYSHVFGLPEHASPFSLKTTRGRTDEPSYKDPYRLFNLDVFEYEHDSEMALYGSIPYMVAQRPGSAVSVFWLNAAETWVDVEKIDTSAGILSGLTSKKKAKSKSSSGDGGPTARTTTTHWISETGILDLFVSLGPTIQDLAATFGSLTGTTVMPPYFSVAYHQCRWNYVSQEDVVEVVKKFDEHDIPLDVMWLDIEYAAEHKYFIWDQKTFPDPDWMLKELEATGRKLVTIVDPHIKRTPDLYVYKEAQALDVLCKQPDGKTEYEGWCWTGSSSWADFFNPDSWAWWASLFRFDKFRGSSRIVHNWLDMNEPSVFNAPEITMPRDNIHYGGWEHRDLHNLNAMVSHNASHRGLRERTDPPMRGMVLARGFFAGSQRYGPIWQGDNLCTWEHLAVSVPMMLSNGIAGMAFNGPDVGGFFGNPSPEMLVRWYQAGAFMPWFRAHAHIDTKRREPYLFDEPIRGHIRNIIRLRYSLLPTWYTAFFENTISGLPIGRPQSIVFPQDEQGLSVDDQYFVGSSGLLVKPVVQQGVYDAQVYIADDEPYYNYFTNDVFFGNAAGGGHRFTLPAPLETLPLFVRGGHIFTRRDLVRRAAPLMWRDPITLVVATGLGGEAEGSLYLDDGESEQHLRGQFIYRGFTLRRTNTGSLTLASRDLAAEAQSSPLLPSALQSYVATNAFATKAEPVVVGDVVVLGLAAKPACVKAAGRSSPIAFDWKDGVSSSSSRRKAGLGQAASVLTIKSAGLPVARDWALDISLQGPACQVQPTDDPYARLQSPECPLGQSRCANVGHRPACILISRINDGICDPECCDGSDETDGKVKCPNRCKELGDLHRKELEAEARKFRVGGKERQNYIAFGKREQKKLTESLAKLEVEITFLKDKERAAKTALERTEATQAADIEKKKASVLYARIVEHQRAIKMLRTQREELEGDLSQLKSILTDLKAGYNPNYQDMAVKGAVKGFEDFERSLAGEAPAGPESESDPPEEEVKPDVDQADARTEAEFDDERLTAMEEEDPLVLMSSLEPDSSLEAAAVESAGLLFKLEEYLPDGLRPSFDAFRTRLLDLLAMVGVLPGGAKSVAPESSSERPDVVKAKSAHSGAEKAVQEAQSKLDETKAVLGKDWGREWEFKKLDGQCFEQESGDYTYELCMFGKAAQKGKHGMRTELGSFASWAPDAQHGTDGYYVKQVYNRGTRCWNGPERSVKVDLSCGTTNAITSVMEPEKCEYRFKMTTPAVCFPSSSPGAGETATEAKTEL